MEPIYGRCRKWLSEDSWSKYYEGRERQRVADSIGEPSAKELEGEEEQIESETAEEEAKDAKFLIEKCPGCTEKCKWYFEKLGAKK